MWLILNKKQWNGKKKIFLYTLGSVLYIFVRSIRFMISFNPSIFLFISRRSDYWYEWGCWNHPVLLYLGVCMIFRCNSVAFINLGIIFNVYMFRILISWCQIFPLMNIKFPTFLFCIALVWNIFCWILNMLTCPFLTFVCLKYLLASLFSNVQSFFAGGCVSWRQPKDPVFKSISYVSLFGRTYLNNKRYGKI